jgi:predicted dehydrogenase
MRVAIVGCGRVGEKRARALGEDDRLVAAVDVDETRAAKLAATHPGCTAGTDHEPVVARADVDVVVVATTNDGLTPVAAAAVKHGKHVRVETAARAARSSRRSFPPRGSRPGR